MQKVDVPWYDGTTLGATTRAVRAVQQHRALCRLQLSIMSPELAGISVPPPSPDAPVRACESARADAPASDAPASPHRKQMSRYARQAPSMGRAFAFGLRSNMPRSGVGRRDRPCPWARAGPERIRDRKRQIFRGWEASRDPHPRISEVEIRVPPHKGEAEFWQRRWPLPQWGEGDLL